MAQQAKELQTSLPVIPKVVAKESHCCLLLLSLYTV